MTFKLGSSSKANLRGVHDLLQDVVNEAINISTVDFSVVEGVRSKERQAQLLAQGKSWTMNSRHITGHAVDIYPWVDGQTNHDEKHYKKIAKAMFAVAIELGVNIEWGGLWNLPNNNDDKPHWQLCKIKYK